jgi:hypothetical protein
MVEERRAAEGERRALADEGQNRIPLTEHVPHWQRGRSLRMIHHYRYSFNSRSSILFSELIAADLP